MKLINGNKYDVNDVLKGSQCICGADLDFQIFPDANCIDWVAECGCGRTISLNQSTILECDIDENGIATMNLDNESQTNQKEPE